MRVSDKLREKQAALQRSAMLELAGRMETMMDEHGLRRAFVRAA